jgi:hypothetical protein
MQGETTKFLSALAQQQTMKITKIRMKTQHFVITGTSKQNILIQNHYPLDYL